MKFSTDGQRLNGLEKLASEISHGSSDEDLLAVARAFSTGQCRDVRAITRLAESLAQSGTILSLPQNSAGDVASTGGPASLSTLLGPLYLASAGVVVPKLGVPGRPAGGIDCLAQLRGYRTRLSPAQVSSVLAECGYAHFLPSDSFAPLDARLFGLRQRNGIQAVPALVIASLLSKKMAVGLTRFSIDVRVFPHGNFGANWEEARLNAALFRQAATFLGLDPAMFLTDARFPLQPFVGRREALWALGEIFDTHAASDLALHAQQCHAMARACAPGIVTTSRPASSLRDAFIANVVAQGSNAEAFDALVESTKAAHVHVVHADAKGYFSADLARLRTVIVDTQSKIIGSSEFPDPLGIRLLARSGEWVEIGHPVATVRASEDVWKTCSGALTECIGHPGSKPIAAGF